MSMIKAGHNLETLPLAKPLALAVSLSLDRRVTKTIGKLEKRPSSREKRRLNDCLVNVCCLHIIIIRAQYLFLLSETFININTGSMKKTALTWVSHWPQTYYVR